MVEHQPSKLRVAGSSLVSRSDLFFIPVQCQIAIGEWMNEQAFADVAQLVEHILGRDEVTGSILVIGSFRSKLICALKRVSHVAQWKSSPVFRKGHSDHFGIIDAKVDVKDRIHSIHFLLSNTSNIFKPSSNIQLWLKKNSNVPNRT